MKRWDETTESGVENKAVDDFLHEILAVCERHKMSLSHEDKHGSFIVEKFDKDLADWLINAAIGKSVGK
jgi:hypothetical protein